MVWDVFLAIPFGFPPLLAIFFGIFIDINFVYILFHIARTIISVFVLSSDLTSLQVFVVKGRHLHVCCQPAHQNARHRPPSKVRSAIKHHHHPSKQSSSQAVTTQPHHDHPSVLFFSFTSKHKQPPPPRPPCRSSKSSFNALSKHSSARKLTNPPLTQSPHPHRQRDRAGHRA